MPDGQGRAEATGGRRLEVSTADSTSEVPGCYHGSPHWLGPRDRKGVSRIGHFHPACSPTAERGGGQPLVSVTVPPVFASLRELLTHLLHIPPANP